MDKRTVGIPKIVYLVGWQYNGHDSKYPAWFEVNERLKRPEDKTALESLKWLMKEATTVSYTHLAVYKRQIHISYPTDLKAVIQPKHRYDQTLTMKLFLSQALYDGKFKRKDNGVSEVALTFVQALEVIKNCLLYTSRCV